MAQTFTTDLVRRAIKSCRNNKAFRPDKLSIFHQIPHRPLQPLSHDLLDYGDMEVFIDHPNTETWKGYLRRNFVSSYLASLPSGESTRVSDSAHYQQISPTCSRPTRIGPDHSTTTALLQMTTYIAMLFNQRMPPDRTICVDVDLSAAFDTVGHNNLLSKINRSQLPPPGHSVMAVMLSERKTSQDLLQRCKI